MRSDDLQVLKARDEKARAYAKENGVSAECEEILGNPKCVYLSFGEIVARLRPAVIAAHAARVAEIERAKVLAEEAALSADSGATK